MTIYIRKISRSPIEGRLPLGSSSTISLGLLLPIGGWLADAFFGRYRVVRCGMWIMWFGSMLNGLSLLVGKVIETYGTCCDPWMSLVSKVMMGVGLGAFQANIVQFGLDQLTDASSTEIQSVIAWYTMTGFFSAVTVYFSSFCVQEYVAVIVVSALLSMAICSDFLVGHWLTKEQIINDPLPLILKVVYYTIKGKIRNRNTYYPKEQGYLSTFNIAKKIYNGPFTSEQVEDVKAFFRVLIVIVIFVTFSSGSLTVSNVSERMAHHLRNWPNGNTISSCYHGISIFYSTYLYPALVLIICLAVIRPLFHRCIPNVKITLKFLISLLFLLVAVLVLLGIQSNSYISYFKKNVTCIFENDPPHLDMHFDAHWIILPNTLNGLSMLLFILSGIEFICAQAPFNMKGLVIGIGCALFGLCALIHSSLSEVFTSTPRLWKKAPLTCGIWFFMMEGVIVLVGFILAVVMVKLYKKRERTSSFSRSDWEPTY